MTTDPYDRIAELGAELQSLGTEMRRVMDDYRRICKETPYVNPPLAHVQLCEARCLGIATELRVILAGARSA